MSGIIWGGSKGSRNYNRNRKIKRRSSTAGKDKGGSCVADTLSRYFASKSRSYKHIGYQAWLEKTRAYNNVSK